MQEYCCTPADDNSAFFSYEMINSCADPALKLMSLRQLLKYCETHPDCSLYMGVDVGRTKDLFVMDVGEKIGDASGNITLDGSSKTVIATAPGPKPPSIRRQTPHGPHRPSWLT